MKKIARILLLLGVSYAASAAASISLKLINREDLQVMVDFVNQHQKVIETLESIDFQNATVYFDGGCKATFTREKTGIFEIKSPPAVLKFDSSNCALTYEARPSES